MLQTVAIRGYRSLREVILPLSRLSIVTGENGAGKSSLYRALRLLEYLKAEDDGAADIELYKDFGETRVGGQSLLTTPPWDWGKR